MNRLAHLRDQLEYGPGGTPNRDENITLPRRDVLELVELVEALTRMWGWRNFADLVRLTDAWTDD